MILKKNWKIDIGINFFENVNSIKNFLNKRVLINLLGFRTRYSFKIIFCFDYQKKAFGCNISNKTKNIKKRKLLNNFFIGG